jgi:hypothetical protein
MRTLITIAAFVTGISITSAQELKEAQVPEAVKNAFKAKFPQITDPEWEKEGNDYEAEFRVKRVNMDNGKAVKGRIERSVLFNTSGELLQTEDEIRITELPAAVNDYIAKNLNGKKVKEAAKITEAGGKIMYEAEIEKEDYIFDADGNFLKKETEAEKDDSDDKKKAKKAH